MSEINPTVLIAENDALSYLVLRSIVKKHGLHVVWAQNGLKAIELFCENPNIIMVFMDINMPIMDGLEATKKIKELDKAVPVIIQTACIEYRKTGIECGCDEFILKPYDFMQIKNVIAKHIDNDIIKK